MSGTANFKLVGLDTSVFIYYVQGHSTFGSPAKEIIHQLAAGNMQTVTSVLTITELLAYRGRGRMRPKNLKKLRKRTLEKFLEYPNVSVVDVSTTIAVEAGRIRQEHGIRLPDAVHLATAITAGAESFITNDKRLKRCKEITVRTLK